MASNIGYRRLDGKWITLYNSIFIVLNDVGQIVMWQFTKTTGFDEVTPMLTTLVMRINQPIKIYVDNCCQQRAKLKQIFGQETIVNLDLFHAVQRLTRVMPKRHPMYSCCINDLKLIFRSSGDMGKKRQCCTPNDAQLLQNIEKKWSNYEYNGWRLFNHNVELQINSLKVHILKGCLSNIDKGEGTNRNEVLHRHINPHFRSRSRIELPLALALLSILFF